MSHLKPIRIAQPADNSRFAAVDPLDCRYYDPTVALYLSEQTRVQYQAHVEAALAHALADFGMCSRSIAQEIEASAREVDVEAVYAEEQITKHDIKALVNCIKAEVSDEAKPYVHFGATSYDIISTATSLQLRGAISEVVLPRLIALLNTLNDLTKRYATTTQVGRTHGQHAVPITFGFALSGYVNRLGESMQQIRSLADELRGKFSGAVGAYNALSVFVDDPLRFEEAVLAYVDLKPARQSTQIVPADAVVRLLDELAITANIMANLAHDMRHLQRSEINEVREKFDKGQTGSSTMAHKRNPLNFENIISMSKQVTAQIVNANLNISSEHQRDLTDSASSRFYGVAVAVTASMLERLERVMSKLEVDQLAMDRNLAMTGGAIAAEPLYLLLQKYGHTNGHEAAKVAAHKALDSRATLVDVVQKDTELSQYWDKLRADEKQLLTSPDQYYTGLAAAKALAVHDYWKQKIPPLSN